MDRFEKLLTCISSRMVQISGVILMVLMLLTVFNVVARLFDFAPIGIPEMVGYGMVIVICFGFAYNAITKGNVVIDMLFEFLPERVDAFVKLIIDFLGLVFFLFMTWQGIVSAWEEYQWGDISPILEFPIAPFRACLIFGFGMLCVVLFLDMLKSFKKAATK